MSEVPAGKWWLGQDQERRSRREFRRACAFTCVIRWVFVCMRVWVCVYVRMNVNWCVCVVVCVRVPVVRVRCGEGVCLRSRSQEKLGVSATTAGACMTCMQIADAFVKLLVALRSSHDACFFCP